MRHNKGVPRYRIYSLKESQRPHFRNTPPGAGGASAPGAPLVLKPKDYQEQGEMEASSPYAAWRQRRGSEAPIGVGDVLEAETGQLLVCRFVGFEEARWWAPEPPAAIPRPVLPQTSPPP